MVEPQLRLGGYLHLARENGANSTPGQQDKLMILGAVCADEMNLPDVANFCRAKLIQKNAGHLLSHYDSVQHALQQDEFQKYLQQIQREYPWEKVEHMVESSGLDLAQEHAKFSSDLDFAASLLETTAEELTQPILEKAEVSSDQVPDQMSDQDVLGAAEESIFGEDAVDDMLEGFDINDIIAEEDEQMKGFSSPLDQSKGVSVPGSSARSSKVPSGRTSASRPKQTRSLKPGEVPHLLEDDELSEDLQPSAGMSSMSISVTDLGDILPEGAERPDFKKDFRLDEPAPEENPPSEKTESKPVSPSIAKSKSGSSSHGKTETQSETSTSGSSTTNSSTADSTQTTIDSTQTESNSAPPMSLGQRMLLALMFFGVALLIFATVLNVLGNIVSRQS